MCIRTQIMKKTATTLLTLAIASLVTIAQTNYNDVLVIVNSNSTMSQDVANYFKAQRSIPNVNICSIAMPTTEEIDSVTCASIYTTIKNYIVANGLTSSINYIVTTQGVPLKVRRSSSVFSITSNASSFDSELMLLQSSYEPNVGKAGYDSNPYLNSSTAFSRSGTWWNIRLVTRLAGYSYSDIVGLIDRGAQPYNSSGTFVFDQDPTKNGTLPVLNNRMTTARDTLVARGYSALLNTTTQYVVNQTNVLGYVSWGSNDANWSSYTQKAQPHFTWSAKALAETYVSTSGRSFADSNFVEPTTGWQSMVADLIHENGVTGVKGYVWEPYTGAMARVNVLFDRWTSGRNLAESFWSATLPLGWMDVVIGDPKSTFAGNGHLPVELVAFNGLYRNGKVELRWKTATEKNNHGFEIERRASFGWETLGFVVGAGTSERPIDYTFIDEKPRTTNTYRLKQIDRDGTMDYSNVLVVEGYSVADFTLNQNYPNPFNPSTTLSFFLPEAGSISLTIYNTAGEHVTSILNDEPLAAGTHTFQWDARNSDNIDMPSGTYLYAVSGSSGGRQIVNTKTMQLIR